MSTHGHSLPSPVRRARAWPAWLCAIALLAACSTTGPPEPEDRQGEIAALEARTVADVTERHPDAQEALDRAVGYAVFSKHSTKYPLVGRGAGYGVAVDTLNDERHYLRVEHFDVGGGLGDLSYRLLVVFFDRDDFERLRTGRLAFGASIDAAGGSKDEGPGESGRTSLGNENREVYLVSDAGVTATWSVRMLRFTPWDEGG